MAFAPYIFFSGNCREAFTRYQEVFGGELNVLTMADVPPDAAMPGADPAMVMHASLMVGDAHLMGSDDPTGTGGPKVGSAVSFSAGTASEASRVFEALSDGGEVTMPVSATFWSAAFGMCTDRFGVPWMVGTSEGAPTA